MSTTLRIGTRGSALALAQASIVRDALRASDVNAELEIITTAGDRRAPDTAWGEGAFVSAIEDALVAGRIDIAVHSAKDLPTDEDPRLAIAAFLERARANDVVVVPSGRTPASLADLPEAARVGTDSPRRTAFLRAVRADLAMHPLHGNVDTRLRRLDEGQSDALVLAEAGLARLGRADRIAFRLPPELLPPAPGQGALAVQIRSDDAVTRERVAVLDHAPTRIAVTLERDILAASGGGCRAPIGTLATVEPDGSLEVIAGFARPDGSVAHVTHQSARTSGLESRRKIVDAVLAQLAGLAAGTALRRGWPRVLVTRGEDQAPALALSLVDRGFAPLLVPAIAIEPIPGALDDAVRRWAEHDWVVLTSANAAAATLAALAQHGGADEDTGPRWAALGRATSRVLTSAGLMIAFRPEESSGRGLAEGLPITAGDRVLVPRSDAAGGDLIASLERRGATVEAVVAYRTVEAPESSVARLGGALAERPAAVIFTSGSTVRGLLRLAERLGRADEVTGLPAICIGEPTAAEARDLGFRVAVTSTRQAVGAIADSTAGYLGAQEVAS